MVIEHNLDVIKVADYLVDLGPEGGDGGGTIVAEGTPEEVCRVKASYTGKYLKGILARDRVEAPEQTKMTLDSDKAKASGKAQTSDKAKASKNKKRKAK